jgi:hypothetical protein
MSCCTTTVPNSVRNSAPVGQTSRQAAEVQCLQTSELISQRMPSRAWGTPVTAPEVAAAAAARSTSGTGTGLACSMKATCRQVLAPRAMVLS